MNKHDLISLFRQWQENGENEKIIKAVMSLPDSKLDDDYLGWLVDSYINEGEYKRAIAVLESRREQNDRNYKWHFRMGLALWNASEDEECEDDEELQINILNRAKVALARGMNLNPPAHALNTADIYMEKISQRLDELYGDEEEEDGDAEDYEDEDIDALEEHIKDFFGDFPTVFHEINSPDIYCDICVIPPSKEKNYFTLVTMGMGAHAMNVPKELPEYEELEHAELVLCLPPDWKVGESDEKWFWPFTLLKSLARLPINCSSWLGWGHSVDNCLPFAENTKLCGSILLFPTDIDEGGDRVTLPSGTVVNFFEVIPLYREEMNFKKDNDTESLLERMKFCDHVVDINRPNCCEDYDGIPIVDSAQDHSSKIIEKKLPLDTINGCNHIAVYLRWCIEHGLTAPEFSEVFPDVISDVLSGRNTDLRRFILDSWDGKLALYAFNFLGSKFAERYYNWDTRLPDHFYPSDVDAAAEEYFGSERYNSDEFQDEAYLFVPFDENYYKALSKYIESAFNDFYRELSVRCSEYSGSLTASLNRKTPLRLKHIGTGREFSAELKERVKAQCSSEAPKLVIIDDLMIDDEEKLADCLAETLSTDIIFKTVALLDVPDEEKWLDENFVQGDTIRCNNKNTARLYRAAADFFGEEIYIFTYNTERSALLIPHGDGTFDIRLGKGFDEN